MTAGANRRSLGFRERAEAPRGVLRLLRWLEVSAATTAATHLESAWDLCDIVGLLHSHPRRNGLKRDHHRLARRDDPDSLSRQIQSVRLRSTRQERRASTELRYHSAEARPETR